MKHLSLSLTTFTPQGIFVSHSVGSVSSETEPRSRRLTTLTFRTRGEGGKGEERKKRGVLNRVDEDVLARLFQIEVVKW